MTKYSIQPNKAFVSQSLSAEHSEKQPPHNAESLSSLTLKLCSKEKQQDKLKLSTLCNNIFRNMEDMRYNEAGKKDKAKTSHVPGQNPWPDMQVLPDALRNTFSVV